MNPATNKILTIGTFIILAIATGTLIFLLLLQRSSTSTTITQIPPSQTEQPIAQPDIAKLPSVDFEATIVELYVDPDEDDCAERCSGLEYPHDSALIRIDSVNASDDPKNEINLVIGEEIQVEFRYSARPAKLKKDPVYLQAPAISSDPNATVSHENPLINPVPIEDGYFIYNVLSSDEADKTLPGLKQGDQIKVFGFYPIFGVGEYELK